MIISVSEYEKFISCTLDAIESLGPALVNYDPPLSLFPAKT